MDLCAYNRAKASVGQGFVRDARVRCVSSRALRRDAFGGVPVRSALPFRCTFFIFCIFVFKLTIFKLHFGRRINCLVKLSINICYRHSDALLCR